MINDITYLQEHLTEAEKWGQLAEEAAELSQAALKMQRLYLGLNLPRADREACEAAVLEEHADVAVCFKVLGWNDKAVRAPLMATKLNRWANNITKNMKENV